MKTQIYTLLPALFLACISFGQASQLDSSFNQDGRIFYNLPNTTHDGRSIRIAIQPDGKLLSVGNYYTDQFIFVARTNDNSSPDMSFGSNGLVKDKSVEGNPDGNVPYVEDVLVQPDGKILVAGWAFKNTPAQYHLIMFRLNADGTRDKSFGINGYVKGPVTDSLALFPRKMALQADGKIVVVAYSSSDYQEYVLRFKANGKLDPSFGTNGFVQQLPFPQFEFTSLYNVFIQSNGRIVCTGSANINGRNDVFLAAGYTGNGSIDAGFATNGLFTYDIAPGYSNEDASFSILLPGDKFILGGFANSVETSVNRIAMIRCNSNGSVDNSFGINGVATRPFSQNEFTLSGMVPDNKGNILFGGSYAFNASFWRFTPDGKEDHTYGTKGEVKFTTGRLAEVGIQSIAMQPDNKLVAAGYIPSVTDLQYAELRFKSDPVFITGANTAATAGITVQQSVSVAPNPATDMIRIAGLDARTNATITITGPGGLVWNTVTVNKVASTTINISALKQGMYYVAVKQGDTVAQVKLLKE